MISAVRRTRLALRALLCGVALALAACDLSPGQLQDSGAAAQPVMDVVQAFILDFARQVIQAALL